MAACCALSLPQKPRAAPLAPRQQLQRQGRQQGRQQGRRQQQQQQRWVAAAPRAASAADADAPPPGLLSEAMSQLQRQLLAARREERELARRLEEVQLAILTHSRSIGRQRTVEARARHATAAAATPADTPPPAAAPAPVASCGTGTGTVAAAAPATLVTPHSSSKKGRLKKRSKSGAALRAMVPAGSASSSTQRAAELAAEAASDVADADEPGGATPLQLSNLTAFERELVGITAQPPDPHDHCVLPKPIFVVSDCTGKAASAHRRAASPPVPRPCRGSHHRVLPPTALRWQASLQATPSRPR